MPTLSAVMIVKNEAHSLDEALAALAWVDELIVVDAGSDDDTPAIARRHTDKVYIEDDWQGYGIQRQRAQAYASGEWILMIDADERVSDRLKAAILAAVDTDDRSRAYALGRLSYVFGRFIRHGGWYPDYVIRLYPKDRAAYGDDKVHEKLRFAADMQVVRLEGDLLHYTYRDMQHYLVKSAGYAAAWAETRYARGKRTSLLTGFLHGLGCFVRMYILRLGFLDGRQGLLLASLSAHSTFVKYADLWTRYQSAPSTAQNTPPGMDKED